MMKFAKEREVPEENRDQPWKVLIVDDEQAVHVVTVGVIEDLEIDNRKLQVFSAYSASEAKTILEDNPDMALAIVDVVMETSSAGLDLIKQIRQQQDNQLIRLVIRTGQPNEAPEKRVIEHYDINDYKEKTELTSQKLYTLVRSSIKQYGQLLQLEDKYQTTYHKMTTHPLTGLMNRAKLTELLDEEGTKSLILINIDGFSLINETQSFEAGDHLLKQMAQFLLDSYGQLMNVFHLEADIFALLYDGNLPVDNDRQLAEIKQHISQNIFKIQEIDTTVTVTIGIAMHEEGNLIQKAELALKEARQFGQNQFQIYSKDLNIIKTIHSNSIWTKRVRDALKEDRIIAYYQPVLSLKTDRIEKYELLARLVDDEGIHLPSDFLDAAFYSGQTYAIFQVMFARACEMTRQHDYEFSVNIALDDLRHAGLLEFVKETMQQHQVPSGRVALELLEYQSFDNNMALKQLLTKLHQAGLQVSIDDFGAHCSNFSQITDLPIDVLKIDGSFISKLPGDKHSQVVSSTITSFAHQMDIPVVAEFVSSEEILQAVKALGIDYAQGWHLGKPAPEIPAD